MRRDDREAVVKVDEVIAPPGPRHHRRCCSMDCHRAGCVATSGGRRQRPGSGRCDPVRRQCLISDDANARICGQSTVRGRPEIGLHTLVSNSLGSKA